ncbi:hypothetical protein P3W45_000458 [Vairimorpha bombi]|jgi:hypothetical protein
MYFFILTISTTIPNTYYISPDLVISCLHDDISKYKKCSVINRQFEYKENIMKSQKFKNKIDQIKKDPLYIKIDQLPSKVKIILFMYQDNPMMIVHRSIIFLSSFFEFYDFVIDFFIRLGCSSEDIQIASESLYEELKTVHLDTTRMRGVSSNDVHTMMSQTIFELVKYRSEIYNFNLTFNSRSSESYLLGFFFISNVLEYRTNDFTYIDFGFTCLDISANLKFLLNYDMTMNQYKLNFMYELINMFVKSFLIVEVKTKIINKQNGLIY